MFDGVFTKLSVWKLVEYDKVLLLDLDIIPCKSLAELFELRCPAALIRGQGERSHGQNIDGKHFFVEPTVQTTRGDEVVASMLVSFFCSQT